MDKRNSMSKRAAAALKGIAEKTAVNAVGKKYLIFFHETEVPEAVRKFVKNK